MKHYDLPCRVLNNPFASLPLPELALDASHLGLPLLVVAQQNTPPPYCQTEMNLMKA